MFKRRFRLPSPALVISTVALAVALGGTAFAANSAATAKRHKDKKADVKLIKKLAATLNVKHATSANNATTAVTATNAATATNATHLGGVAASSYLTNGGTIFVATGTSNWVANEPSTDPIDFQYDVSTDVTARTATTVSLVAHPSLPTELYGKKLEVTSATLCYTLRNAEITEILVARSTFSNSGNPTFGFVVNDVETRTGHACVVFPVSNTLLSSFDDIGLFVEVHFDNSSAELDIGQSGLTLKPTTTAASAAKSSRRGSS